MFGEGGTSRSETTLCDLGALSSDRRGVVAI